MRVLVTGSRNWPDYNSVASALARHIHDVPPSEEIVIVHGGCPTGADLFAGRLADNFGLTEESHPADWETHGKAAGPIRNQKMVDLGADICVAFPLGASKGTRHCMRAAAKAGIPVYNESGED